MIYSRTNKAETAVEVLKVDEVAFIRGKIEDIRNKIYKVQVFLKCGTIIHMNLGVDEFNSLVESFGLWNCKAPILGLAGMDKPKFKKYKDETPETPKEEEPTTLDDVIDSIKIGSQDESKDH